MAVALNLAGIDPENRTAFGGPARRGRRERATTHPDEEWATVVRNVPLVAADLVVRHDGGVVLGKRENEPARGEWFVPGGAVFKGERLAAAARRIARSEVGVDARVERRLGVYEHFYDVADVPDAEGKHYVAVGFVVDPLGEVFEADDQHSQLRVFRPPFDDLPPYVEAYLDDAGIADGA